MANVPFPDYLDRLLDPNGTGNGGAAVDWNTDTITASLHSSTYTYDNTDEDFADLTGQIDSQRETLTTVTVSHDTDSASVDSDDVEYTTVASGSTVDSYIYSKSTDNTANDQLIAYFDTDDGGAISVATNDGDITIVQPASGILTLS